MAVKYRAVVTVNRMNYRVSPWFTSAREAENWATRNKVRHDAILPASNWQEICLAEEVERSKEKVHRR